MANRSESKREAFRHRAEVLRWWSRCFLQVGGVNLKPSEQIQLGQFLAAVARDYEERGGPAPRGAIARTVERRLAEFLGELDPKPGGSRGG